MKRSCKHVDIKDTKTVLPWVADCVYRHWKRNDFRRLILSTGVVTAADYVAAKQINDKRLIAPAIPVIAQMACEIIRRRDFDLPPIRIRKKCDHTTGKERDIGCESPMQQVLDYIAVHSCTEIWRRRMSRFQMSSIPNRGQVLGIKMLRKFVRKDRNALSYAKKHGWRYCRKCRYRVKLDIRKCFPSSKAEVFMRLFVRDCASKDIVWLWATLLFSHRVGGYRGFMIGSLASQWAAQYLISFIYTFSMALRYRGRKAVTTEMMFMDDMGLFSSSRAALKYAVKAISAYSREVLGYDIKLNWHIEDMEKSSLDMMGFVIHISGKVTMRERNFIHSRRIMIRVEISGFMTHKQAVRLLSYKGFYKYSDSRTAEENLNYTNKFMLAAKVVSNHDRRLLNAA